MKQNYDKNELKKMQRASLAKLAAVAVFIVVVVIFNSLSWFTMSREVEGAGVQMTAEDVGFELRFKGENVGALSYTKTSDDPPQYATSPVSEKTSIGDYARSFIDGVFSSPDYYETDGSHTSVILRLDGTARENGLNPGAGGEIIFWVVPKKTGTLTVKFSLNMRGYTAIQSSTSPYDVSSLTPIPETVAALGDNPTDAETEEFNKVSTQIQAVKYLRKHILFFKGEKSGNNWTYTDFMNDDLIRNGYYPMTFNAVKDEPIEVRFRWDWTNTFKQMVLPSSGNAPEAVTSNETVRGEIQQYACNQYADVFKGITLADVQSKMMKLKTNKYEFDEDTLNTGTNLDDLSRGYNRADSEIGKNIDYILLVLGAE